MKSRDARRKTMQTQGCVRRRNHSTHEARSHTNELHFPETGLSDIRTNARLMVDFPTPGR
jgi:hypothetical protein